MRSCSLPPEHILRMWFLCVLLHFGSIRKFYVADYAYVRASKQTKRRLVVPGPSLLSKLTG